MEQIVRDARIAMLYEGTNGIQALDLLGRKVVASDGALLNGFVQDVQEFIEQHQGQSQQSALLDNLQRQLERWQSLSRGIIDQASKDPAAIGAASFDFLLYSGYTVLAYLLLRSAMVAEGKLKDHADDGFYQAKLDTARFYFDHVLPRNEGLAVSILAGPDSMMNNQLETLDR